MIAALSSSNRATLDGLKQQRRRSPIASSALSSSVGKRAGASSVARRAFGRDSGSDSDGWIEKLKQGIPEVEAPDYSSDGPTTSTSSTVNGRPRAPGTTPLGARPRRGSTPFSSLSSYSSDDEARSAVRRQERVILDAWTGVGSSGEEDATKGRVGRVLSPSVPVVGGVSALLLLALLVAAGPPS